MSAQIISSLKQLKLHGMAASFPEVCAQARHTEFNPESFMHQLILSESAERCVRSTAYQMAAARFAAHRDLAGFAFAEADVDELLVRKLELELPTFHGLRISTEQVCPPGLTEWHR